MKDATVRFYFDADILGVGKLIAGLRGDCTFPGDTGAVIHKRRRPACSVMSPAAKDTEWIPRVSAEGLLIITRDTRIQHRTAEVLAVREHQARMVALAGKDAGTVWTQLEVLMRQWRAIEKLQAESGPFIYRATRSSLGKIALPE